MYKPWKKMTKDEKLAWVNCKIVKGFGVFLFGAVWMYFASVYVDVWDALPPTLALMGLLVVLYGLIKKFSV